MAWMRALLLGLLYAALMTLSNAPFDLWWVGLLAPAPLIWLAVRPRMAPSRAGFWAAIGVSPWWVLSHAWVAEISAAGVVPLVIYLSVWSMMFVWLAGRVASRWPKLLMVFVPALWVGLEYLRGSLLFSGYAWFLAGHPMIDSPGSGLAHPAVWGGAYLVSWLVLLAPCALVVIRSSDRSRLETGLAVCGFAVWMSWLGAGLTVWPSPTETQGKTLRVAVVQSNVPQSNKVAWRVTQRYLDWLDLRDLTLEAAATRPDLIVWPETMFSGYTLDADSVQAERRAGLEWPIDREADPRLQSLTDRIDATTIAVELQELQRGLGIPMLVGATGYDGFEILSRADGGLDFDWQNQHNSVFLIEGGRVSLDRYNKMVLMPFGEIMPYLSRWPWLERRLLAIGAEGMQFGLSEGEHAIRFEVGSARIATPICFESTMPAVTRALVFENGERAAGLIVNPSNDGWFGESVAMRRHYLRASRWRCVELATPMVRACNTGISAAIDHRGRILQDTRSTEAIEALHSGVLVAEIRLGQGKTVYSRFGDLFGAGSAILAVIIAVGGLLSRRNVKAPEPSETQASDTED